MEMPLEGATERTIKDVARRDVPTCRLDQSLADVRAALPKDWDVCVVINPDQIVLGLLESGSTKDGSSIEELMNPAPTTFRPGKSVVQTLEYFRTRDKSFALVTKSTGQLIGLIRKIDLE